MNRFKVDSQTTNDNQSLTPKLNSNIQLYPRSKYKHAPLHKSKINPSHLHFNPSDNQFKSLQPSSSTTQLAQANKRNRLNLNIAITEDLKHRHSESTGNLFANPTKIQTNKQSLKRQIDTNALITTLRAIEDTKDSNDEGDEHSQLIAFNKKELSTEEREVVKCLKEDFTIHDLLNVVIEQKGHIDQLKALNDGLIKENSRLNEDILLNRNQLEEGLRKQKDLIEELSKAKETSEKKNESLINELIKTAYIKQKMYNVINGTYYSMCEVNGNLNKT